MNVQSILHDYYDRFHAYHGQRFTQDQRSALHAMLGCQQGQYGDLLWACDQCPAHAKQARSCGHRACNQCQYHSTQQWLERQCQKQLPVPYYMVTFTLPYELRATAKAHAKLVYDTLMRAAALTLKRFGLNDKQLNAELGLCAVLHTHTRALDYHPHVHIVIPGGGVHRARKEWRKVKGNYLFNGRALSAAFRGECLHQLAQAGITLPATPKRWVAQCQKVGYGKQALQYLARYLYRGVLSNQNILEDDGTYITFRYQESQSKQWRTRRLKGEDFIALLLQHVLPKGFRRARDYGFLHGNAKAIMRILHWVLKVQRPPKPIKQRTERPCPLCSGVMRVCGVLPKKVQPT